MRKHKHTLRIVLELLIASFILYFINYLVFRDFHHIAMFFTEDIAFIPIEVLITVLIIEKELERREREQKERKINLLTQIFFEEIGNELLKVISSKDKNCFEIKNLLPKNSAEKCDYSEIEKKIEQHNSKIKLSKNDVEEIFEVLNDSKGSIVRFIENPYLDEHDLFTDLLQSAFHIYSDIKHRRKKGEYTKGDLYHISGDLDRIYKYLSKEWVVYLKYVEKEYSYLHKLVLQDMPFNCNKSVLK